MTTAASGSASTPSRSPDPVLWREVGRQLAKAHQVAPRDEPRLHKPKKRDARPYLPPLPEAAFFAAWLDLCECAPAAVKLTHNDVQGMNILCGPSGATIIDWADAAWFDPAYEFGSIPMTMVSETLDGYEETAPLGDGAEGRILLATIGYCVRKVVAGNWKWPMANLVHWLKDPP